MLEKGADFKENKQEHVPVSLNEFTGTTLFDINNKKCLHRGKCSVC